MGTAAAVCTDHNVDGAERTGEHAGFAADTALWVNLHAVILFDDGRYRAALGAGGIFTVTTGHSAALRPGLYHRNTRCEIALTQRMLFIMMSHHAGNFAGATSNTLLAVCHNKTIHSDTRCGPE
jgi:hypothetical protein